MVIDDFNDLAKLSKEEESCSITYEVGDESTIAQLVVVETRDVETIEPEDVATSVSL